MNMPIDIKKYLPLIIAAAAGLIAVVLINAYLTQQKQLAANEAVAGQKNLTNVVIAARDIPSGAALKEDMLKEVSVNRNMLQPRAAQSTDRVVDMVSLAPISKGEQILMNKLAMAGREVSLSSKIPPGKRAITIPVDNVSSVGGMIRPGDHVDVIGSVPVPFMTAEGKQAVQVTSMPLFQDILVLAVGQEFTAVPASQDKKETRTISNIITLALDPQQANLIAFAQEQGKIRLVLRSPGDSQIQPAVPAGWDALFRNVMPPAVKEEPVQQVARPEKTVEIYRGGSKESKALGEKGE